MKSQSPERPRDGSAQEANRGEEATTIIPAYVERTIWTDRMLDALANGVEGGKWYSLIDKIARPASLDAAWQKVRKNRGAKGVDGQTIGDYDRAYRRIHPKLSKNLMKGEYRALPVRRVYIPKAGYAGEKRPLGIPAVVDRVVQQATRNGLEPIFERIFHDHSYGFRPERSTKDALQHVVRCLDGGKNWVVDADLKSFFDTIDHKKLMALVEERVSDTKVLGLLWQFLKAGVMESDQVTWSEEGTPQGGVISPLLANIFLNELDHKVNGAGYEMIRYADDFVVLCRTKEEADRALALVREWTMERGLTLHPEKTRLVDMAQQGATIDFLGFTLKRHTKRNSDKAKIVRLPRQKSLDRLRDGIRKETRRCNGRSLEETIRRITRRIRGWGNYFRSAVRNVHVKEDGWIRMRLRSILRKRKKRKGRGRGADHYIWPDAFFASRGLVSLTEIHDKLFGPKRLGEH